VTTTGGLTVGGNLQVTGTTTTISTENLSIADNMFFLNQVESAGSSTIIADVGWAANVNDDGVYTHVGMFRDATDNTFKVFNEYALEPDSALEIDTGHASFKLAPFAALTLTGQYLGFDSDFGAKSTTNLTEGTNLYYTTARADSDAKNAVSGGTGITYTSATGVIATNDAQIVHDNLSGFVSNKHIDHSGVTITAGSGLTGGGDITATRTLNIGQGTGITVSADAISTNDAQIVHDNLSGFVANEHIDHSTVSVTAGSGLTGGGTIAATRTLNVGAGSYIIVNADDIAVDATSANTVSKVVARDASGNFSAGTITASLTGTASLATEVTATANNSTDETVYITFVDGTTGAQGIETDTGLTYNPSTNTLTTTTFSGALSGNATTATTLQTARTIGGVSFNGSDNINLPGVNTAGNQNTSGTAAIATEVTISANNSTDETVYITFVDGATGDQGIETDTGLTYNPGTGVLSSVDFNSTSDVNLKENIETINNAADKVNALRGVNFNWKDNGRYAMGVVAQEVEEVIPEVVVTKEDGTKTVSYGAMVGLLIEAIKDLQKQVDDLKK
jgi:hypothetical protein